MFKLRDARRKHTRRAFAPLAAVATVMLAVTTVFAAPTVAKANPLVDAWNEVVSFFAGDTGVEPAAEGVSKDADPESIRAWESVAGKTTENIGRIWTDKTVTKGDLKLPASSEGNEFTVPIDDSDFLATLSALSSASNTVTSTSRPLDIVLVLDTSGSMTDSPHMSRYTEIYQPEERWYKTYYTADGQEITAKGEWSGIPFNPKWKFERWELDGNPVTPKDSADDTDSTHIQFYERETITKLQALKDAVNAFADETAKLNDSISDASKQHRISLVTFASDANIDINLTAYTSKNVGDLHDEVNDLRADGATAADEGLSAAKTAFDNRPSSTSQKVVIFFTDGKPTTGTAWSNEVAANAIENAKKLKDAEALVYSIGVFQDADPSASTNFSEGDFNGYMHAVSSNYPKASAEGEDGRRGYYHVTPGARAENSGYYKAATDADELNNIFTQIQEEVQSGTNFPTDVEENEEQGYNAGNSGWLEFTDELGAYMQVDDFKPLVFADAEHEVTKTTSQDGLVDIYTYSGSNLGNQLYPEGDLSQIKITVTHSTDLAKGDVVSVRIPGGLIPVRYFDVNNKDAANPTMSIKEAYPLRLSYGVSVKPGVLKPILNEDGSVKQAALIDAPDDDMKTYLGKNTVDGKAQFYSNLYTGKLDAAQENTIGDTTVTFSPATGNAFYYFTADTPIYHSKSTGDPVKAGESINDDEPHYYQRTYWKYGAGDSGTSGDRAEQVTEWVEIPANSEVLDPSHLTEGSDGNVYIKAGSPHVNRIHAMNSQKTNNATGTAATVADPDWTSYDAPKQINVALGNNGRLSAEVPGTLEITKSTVIPSGFDTNLGNTSFEMVVTSAAMENKAVDAVVKNANGDIQGGYFKLEFGSDGIAKHSIKNGETLYIYGMEDGADYTVAEIAVDGFKQTKSNGTTGKIAANDSSKVSFENTYHADPITVKGDEEFTGVKILTGRDWVDEDKFGFVMQGTNDLGKEVLPNEMKATADAAAGTAQDKEVPFNFGDITFKKPGTYEFQIFEREADSTILGGVSASQALYKVTVTVTDNGKGVLSSEVKMTKTQNDKSSDATDVPADVMTATFTNAYSADGVDGNLVGTKHYTDNSGSNPNLGNMFHFRVTALDGMYGYGPMPAGATDHQIVVSDAGGSAASINFAAAKFKSSMAGHSYTYKVEEVIKGDDDTWKSVAEAITPVDGKYVLDGMTYDANSYVVTVTVELQSDGTIKAVASYPEGNQLDFYNEYTPKPLVLGDKTNNAIKGTKTLTGRNMLSNESFGFTLSATSDVVTGGYTIANGKTSVTGATNNVAKDFSFGDVTFTKPGKYVFEIKETGYNGSDELPDDATPGLKFDRHTCKVTVNVVDNGGTLELAAENGIVYSGGTKNAFNNSYTAKLDLANGVKVSKKLTGRGMKDGEEFTFAVAAAEGDSAAVGKLVDADKSFEVTGLKKDVASVVTALSHLKFNQNDANKTFSFVITENTPAENPKNGLTYNVGGQKYTVAITIADNGNGSLKANTVINNVDGNKVWEGDLAAAPMSDTDALPFTNSYKADPATSFTTGRLGGNKVLSGRNWREGDSFTFTLTGEGNAPMPTSGNPLTLTADQVKALNNGTLEGTKDGKFAFNFGNITYEAVGEYDYTIVETGKGTNANGITYSDNTLKLHVSVNDPGDGQLIATVTRKDGTRDFTNTYSASIDEYGAAANVAVTKQLKNRDWNKDQFTFTVKPADDASAQKAGLKNTEDHEFNFEKGGVADAVVEMPIFEKLKFDQSENGKTFSYTFKEKKGSAGGYTYDGTIYQLDITPQDLGNGKMSVTTKLTTNPGKDNQEVQEKTWSENNQPADFKIAFVNSYEAQTTDTDGAAVVEAKKVLTGRDLIEGEFNFGIVPEGAKQIDKNDVATGANDADGKIIFTPINYKASELNELAKQDNSYVTNNNDGTWTVSYTAYEKAPKEGGGITQTKASFDFTVTVTDEGDSTLSAKVDPIDDATFTNEYGQGESAQAEVYATKTLIGRPQLKDGEFTFTVKPDAANAQAFATGKSTAGADGVATDIDFDDKVDGAQDVKLDYTFAKLKQAVDDGYATYDESVKTWTVNYIMSEDTNDLPGGVMPTEGTDSTQNFSVTVKDNGDGTLSEPEVSPAKLAFSNTYSSSVTEGSEVNLDGKFKKVFTGRDWMPSDTFTFKIKALTDDAPMPEKGDTVTVAGDASGKTDTKTVNFGKIPFDFENIRDADPDEKGERTKTFEYEVWEVVPKENEAGYLPGVKYDGHHAKLTITLTDNGKGELSGSIGETELMPVANVDNGTFTNVYKSELDYGAAGGLTITKTLTGRDMMAGQFQFTMTAKDKASADLFGFGDGMSKVFDSPEGTNGVAAEVAKLKPVKNFTQEDAGAKYEYTLEETKKGGAGYESDSTEHTVTIEVIDNNNGTMTAKTTIDGKSVEYTTDAANTDKAVVAFENSYSAGPAQLEGEGGVSLNATKTLTGRDMKAGEFEFTVYNGTPDEANKVVTGTNEAASDGKAGKVTFSPIEYTSKTLYDDAKAGKADASDPDENGKITYTYNYTVKETSGTGDGVAATNSQFNVTVKVTDNNDGTLSIEVVQTEGGIAFTNTYGESENGRATVSLKGEKQYNKKSSNAPDITGMFTFTLTGSEGAPMPTTNTATNDAAGNVDFGSIEYTMKNVWPASVDSTQAGAEDEGVAPAQSAERTKTFKYTVSESGSMPGVTNDATSKTFQVTVTDDGMGKLSVKCTDAAGNEVEQGAFKFAFVNTYSVAPVTTDAKTSIGGTKELKVPARSERKLADGEFSFTLAPVTKGAPMPKNATVTNDANGNFTFGSMTFDKRGTYEYTLTEDKGTDASVTYDGSVYTVTVKVEDNGKGALVIEGVTYTKNGEPVDAAAFVNEYTVDDAGAMLALGARKNLVGRELKEGEFTFALAYNTDEGEGSVKATNAADGSVTFPEIVFKEPGTYTFTMTEVAGSDETITYDDATYKATVTVTEKNGSGVYDGKLHASVAYEGEAVPVFTNTYTKPADPEPAPKPEEPKAPGLPKTGDDSALPVIVAAVAGVACIGGGLALGRRRK